MGDGFVAGQSATGDELRAGGFEPRAGGGRLSSRVAREPRRLGGVAGGERDERLTRAAAARAAAMPVPGASAAARWAWSCAAARSPRARSLSTRNGDQRQIQPWSMS